MKHSARKRLFLCLASALLAVAVLAGLAFFTAASTRTVFAQQPTGSIPTVTGTAEGPMVTVYSDRDIIEVYAGPSSYLYQPIGILIAGERAPALGYSPDKEWLQIVYRGVPGGVGWIYAPYVSLSPGFSLPVLKAPPTAMPRTTPTIDPTRAAEFGLQQIPERLPTFTQPAPLKVPEFESSGGRRPGAPVGLIILLLALLGVLGAVISFVRGDR